MKYWKLTVLFSFFLFFYGCAATAPQLHRRPAGFWKNKEAVVQVLHFYNQLTTDNKGQPVLDDNGKLTTSIRVNLGTGVVVDTNGLVLTNNHIVNEKCPIVVAPAKITAPIPDDCPLKAVITPDQLATPLQPKIYRVCVIVADVRNCRPAELVAADDNNDLGLVHTNQRFPHAVEFVDDSKLVPGDEVYFWGNVGTFLPPSPFFGRYINRVGPPYFSGNDSGKYNGDLLPLLFMDIYLSPGSSGSPVFDESGKAVGVANSVLPSYTMGLMGGGALGIIIRSSVVIKFIKANPWPRPRK